jgi:urease accessory protein UreE
MAKKPKHKTLRKGTTIKIDDKTTIRVIRGRADVSIITPLPVTAKHRKRLTRKPKND